MEDIQFINSYSFIFSPRPGTPASELNLIDETIAKKRLILFKKLQKTQNLNTNKVY